MSLKFGIAVLALVSAANPSFSAVPDDPAKVNPVSVGAPAPAFHANEVDGTEFHFDPRNLHQPALLIFYRGGWCPFCNTHLQELRHVIPTIRAMGYQVIFLSTDQPKLLYSTLKEKFDYHIVSDSTTSAARAFGVAYHVDDATLATMKTYGIDLDATQGSTTHELPVPSVFIIDRAGIVRFRHFNADFRIRLDGASVLQAVQAITPTDKAK